MNRRDFIKQGVIVTTGIVAKVLPAANSTLPKRELIWIWETRELEGRRVKVLLAKGARD